MRDGPAPPTRGEVLGITAAGVALAVFHAVFWLSRRRGMPWFIDEAGYLTYALDHVASLREEGVGAFVRSVADQHPHAPLIPAVTALVIEATNRPLASAAAVATAAAVGFMLSCWFLARAVLPPAWAVVAAVVTASLPGPLLLGHSFYFAVPAASFFTLGVACLVRAAGPSAVLWASGAGAAMGAAVLTRTMMLGLVPAFVAAFVVQVVRVERGRRQSVVMALAAFGAAMVIAAPWYLRHLSSVLDDIGETGRGAAAIAPRGGGRGSPEFVICVNSSWISTFQRHSLSAPSPSPARPRGFVTDPAAPWLSSAGARRSCSSPPVSRRSECSSSRHRRPVNGFPCCPSARCSFCRCGA